jgi:hypothetical protein
MDIRQLPLEDLVLDPELNLRDKLDDPTVERYVECWSKLPPVTVFEVEGRWLLADGFHRHAAAATLGKPTLEAEVRIGTFEEALDFAAGVNLSHGLPFNRHERRRAVEIKLRLHPDHSDRRLSDELGVSRDLISKVRKSLIEGGQIPALIDRVGTDGKSYPVLGSNNEPGAKPRLLRVASGPDDPRDCGRQEADLAPWEEVPGRHSQPPDRNDEPPWSISRGDAKAMALADPVVPAIPTIDEMLAVMVRQIGEVASWARSDGFEEALGHASSTARNRFRLAVAELNQLCEELGI